ncbi:hypothetical protein OSH11_05510 [Kaistia dalseonensis]|uniref:Uncharacterized protein n=1 Tax=Kaistia dalseonensis TaxID=410840 RepID=A0ABU0H362_9HYPH|nr:hypothetical protein [Kaistia dalseonensis]MCX5494146.1 hypothetical protein [Kaistia dalseonensis]MDQ0436725.1 hypothetical protein [Kaistia dalseonensis]
MMKAIPLALAALAGLGAMPASAEPKPYEPVTVSYDTTGADDAELKTFIDNLRQGVNDNNIQLLKLSVGPDVQLYTPTIGFPEAGPIRAVPNPDKHPGDQRLDEAAILMTSSDSSYTREDLDGLVVDLFGTALEPKTIGVSHTARGALCSPAEPIFDRDKALAVADAADVPPGNLWILSADTEFHEKPDAKSPVIATLPANTIAPFVEGSVDGAASTDGGEEDGGADWYSVALPSGKIGYAAEDTSLAFQAVSICYGKVDNQWAVTGIIVPTL